MCNHNVMTTENPRIEHVSYTTLLHCLSFHVSLLASASLVSFPFSHFSLFPILTRYGYVLLVYFTFALRTSVFLNIGHLNRHHSLSSYLFNIPVKLTRKFNIYTDQLSSIEPYRHTFSTPLNHPSLPSRPPRHCQTHCRAFCIQIHLISTSTSTTSDTHSTSHILHHVKHSTLTEECLPYSSHTFSALVLLQFHLGDP